MNQKTVGEQLVEGELTTGNFTLQATMPMGKTITMSGYIYASSTLEKINKQVDLFHDVIDRQRLKAEIPELEAKRDQRVVQLGQLRDHMAMLSKKKEGGKSLTSKEKADIEVLATNTVRLTEDIAKGDAAIAEARAKIIGS